MRGHTDDWIENRIAHKLSQHKLGGTKVGRYRDPRRPLSAVIVEVAEKGLVGRPVLVIGDDLDRWSLLGTHAIACQEGPKFALLELDEILECNALESGSMPKGSQEYLRIRDRGGRDHVIWVPPGAEFYAIWNIINMLIGMRRKEPENDPGGGEEREGGRESGQTH